MRYTSSRLTKGCVRWLSVRKALGEACESFGHGAPRLPQIVVGPNDIEAKVRLFELGADDHVVEPFDPVEFRARIKSLACRIG
jgi:DNA-binding response OmpR family regulator